MRGDTRAISPAVTQALTIGISTILITGLLLGGSSFLNTKQENIVRQGLQDVGTGVTSDLVRLDQFDKTGVSGNLSFSSGYPDQIGGDPYRIRLVQTSRGGTVSINSTANDLGTQVRFATPTTVCGNEVNGGTIRVVYDANSDCLTVRDV